MLGQINNGSVQKLPSTPRTYRYIDMTSKRLIQFHTYALTLTDRTADL